LKFRFLTHKIREQYLAPPELVPVYRYEQTPGHSIHVYKLAEALPNTNALPR
jgi:hypothetical protein